MEQTQTPIQTWYGRHKDKVTWGMILYLFGTNQAQQPQLKAANERGNYWESKYVQYIETEKLAANRALFKRLLESDSTFIIGMDSSANGAAMVGHADTEAAKHNPH